MNKLSSKELRRFWFRSSKNIGVGITAYSLDDAEIILSSAIKRHILDLDITEVVVDVGIRELDQGHVIPNMNPPIFRGVWFPMFNENLKETWK